MSSPRYPHWLPLNFDVTEQQAAKIEAVRRALGLSTASEVIRTAVAQYNFTRYEARRPPHRQISVRFPPKVREKLRRIAAKKNVSIGELLRVALGQLAATKKASSLSDRKPSRKR